MSFLFVYYIINLIGGMTNMDIKYQHLTDLLRCNKHIKINLIENTNILEIKNLSKVIFKLKLDSTNLEDNALIIYNAITSLNDITLYIPKVYVQEKKED